MRLAIIATTILLLSGCVSSPLQETVEIQQNTIDDLSSRLEKLEGKLDIQQQKIDGLEKELSTMKSGLRKVTPGYLEGTIQEGNF
ncbi:hypothetical protein [Candidatus Uabimicrobium amorphum]|uniref:Uncharacterized protein n=1 Tax=Uabimicrobium amorphum TaxID=2596890 RepID=A0A5S9IKQ8_UABAM|nr:hypothetical protein [Candidatus Uabimicrobium amorphum]BBM83663.1 hypothetical protein UABAM_02016 [Candidatus Uabimicrobium amorphum]